MKIKKFFIWFLMLCSSLTILAETNYKVTTSSRLNVRKAATSKSVVIGTLKSGEEIDVIFIAKGWAKIRYRNGYGYVSEKYIAELPQKVKEEEKINTINEEIVLIEDKEEIIDRQIVHSSITDDKKIPTFFTIRSNISDDINIYLGLDAGVGYSNFIWDNGNVNPTLSYSISLLAQTYFNNRKRFIPHNWYADVALGFMKRGAADFDMNYLQLKICPIGYSLPCGLIRVSAKAGVSLGMPISKLETYSNSWNADFQCGITGGLSFEYKQFAIGCNVMYDFTEVSSSCNQTLNNIAILGTISYKFGEIGHKNENK